MWSTTITNVSGLEPGPALSVSMGDMPDDGYKTFVCVETVLRYLARSKPQKKNPHLAQTICVAKR